MSWVWNRFDNLRADDQSLLDDQNCCIVIMKIWMVCATCDSHKIVRESFNTIWTNRVRSNHHSKIVPLEEWVKVIWSKVDNVVLLLRISGIIVLEATFFFSFMRVAPKEIQNFLVVLRVINSKFYFEWSLNLLNWLDILNCWSDTSMTTENSLLFISNNSSQRHLLKCFIDFHKDTVWVINVLSKSFSAFITKSKIFVHMFIFMVSSKKHDLLWVLKFKSKQETDDLKTVLALIDIVSEEKIVVGVNISSIIWSLPDIKESHKILVLSHDITNDFYRRSDFLNNNWLSSQNLSTFVCQLENVFPLAWEFLSWFNFLSFLWLKKRFQEHLTQSVIWVFINFCMIFLLWIQFLWFFGQFINWNLSDDEWEVFSSRLIDLILLIRWSSNVSLIWKLELSLHIVETGSVLFYSLLFIFICFLARFLRGLDFLEEIVMASKKLLSIDLAYFTQWNIWNLMLETSVDKYIIARSPAWVSKSLYWIKLVPLWRFCVIDLKRNNFSNLISSSSNNHHERSQEKSGVLISWNWSISLILVWGFNPVPSSISMSSETPCVEQTTLISCSSSKANHHSSSTSCLTKSSWVIDSNLWSLSSTIKFDPREWSLFNTKAPNVINSFLTSVTSKNK